MTIRSRVALLVAGLAMTSVMTSVAAHAQSTSPLIGTWDIEYQRGQRIENGEVTAVMGKGVIIIAQSGDSLLATFKQPPRPDGTPVPDAIIGGRDSNGSAVFVQKLSAQMNMNGDVRTVEGKATWTLQATGDTMSGSVIRDIPMMPVAAEPSPVKGTRAKS